MLAPGMRWKKDNIYGFIVIHLLALLALVPWFFSWTGVVAGRRWASTSSARSASTSAITAC